MTCDWNIPFGQGGKCPDRAVVQVDGGVRLGMRWMCQWHAQRWSEPDDPSPALQRAREIGLNTAWSIPRALFSVVKRLDLPDWMLGENRERNRGTMQDPLLDQGAEIAPVFGRPGWYWKRGDKHSIIEAEGKAWAYPLVVWKHEFLLRTPPRMSRDEFDALRGLSKYPDVYDIYWREYMARTGWFAKRTHERSIRAFKQQWAKPRLDPESLARVFGNATQAMGQEEP